VLLFVVYLSANSLAAGYSPASFDHPNSSPLLSVSYGHSGNSFSLRTIQKPGEGVPITKPWRKASLNFVAEKPQARPTLPASRLSAYSVLRLQSSAIVVAR
jgi:hypothetical protein